MLLRRKWILWVAEQKKVREKCTADHKIVELLNQAGRWPLFCSTFQAHRPTNPFPSLCQFGLHFLLCATNWKKTSKSYRFYLKRQDQPWSIFFRWALIPWSQVFFWKDGLIWRGLLSLWQKVAKTIPDLMIVPTYHSRDWPEVVLSYRKALGLQFTPIIFGNVFMPFCVSQAVLLLFSYSVMSDSLWPHGL